MAISARHIIRLLGGEVCEFATARSTKSSLCLTHPRIRPHSSITTRHQSTLQAVSTEGIVEPPPVSTNPQPTSVSSSSDKTTDTPRKPRRISTTTTPRSTSTPSPGEEKPRITSKIRRDILRRGTSKGSDPQSQDGETRVPIDSKSASSRSKGSSHTSRGGHAQSDQATGRAASSLHQSNQNTDLVVSHKPLPQPLDLSGLPPGVVPPEGMHPKKQVRWLRRQHDKLALSAETEEDRAVMQDMSVLGITNLDESSDEDKIPEKKPPKPAPLIARGIPAYDASKPRIRSKNEMEPWQVRKDAIKRTYPEGWSPTRRLSPEALDGIRALHHKYPEDFTTPVLASHFKVPIEAIRRILKSKWQPSPKEDEERRLRWDRRGENIWKDLVEKGVHAPAKWRQLGIGTGPRYRGQDRGLQKRLREQYPDDDHGDVPFEYAERD